MSAGPATIEEVIPVAEAGTGFRVTLGIVTAIVALNAWYGAAFLVAGAWDSVIPFDPPPFLPGDGWSSGGVALALFVAIPMTVACVMLIARRPQAVTAGLVAGILLCVWIVAQVALVGLVMWLQPALFIAGLVIVGLAFAAKE